MKELFTALNAFQKELVTVNKDKANPFYKSKYADLATVVRETQPVLTKHGLAVTQLVDNINGQSALRTMIMHTSGEYIESVMPLLLSKDEPQAQGSAITYARRYSYASALQIVIDEDDDANQTAGMPTIKPLNINVQKTTIFDLLRRKGIEDDHMVDYCYDNYGINLKTATHEQLSEIIAALN